MKIRKNNTHRGLTPFGYCLLSILIVLGFASLFVLLGTVGSYERELISSAEYWSRMIPSALVFGGSAYLFVKIFYEE